jgi:16S rRNA (guanine(966)-N(2))-methyltransferase RsmD
MGMRVIGGTSRGRRLSGPRNLNVRPTADRVKEALFNILADRIAGARVLDLFAGTGNIGIEALSRGAGQVTFVESSPTAGRLLRANLQRCGFERQAQVRIMTVSRFLKQRREPAYDIIFLDPPYRTQEAEKVLPSLERDAIIRGNGVVVVEHFHKSPLDERIGHLARVKTYRYGETCLSVYRTVREGPTA